MTFSSRIVGIELLGFGLSYSVKIKLLENPSALIGCSIDRFLFLTMTLTAQNDLLRVFFSTLTCRQITINGFLPTHVTFFFVRSDEYKFAFHSEWGGKNAHLQATEKNIQLT